MRQLPTTIALAVITATTLSPLTAAAQAPACTHTAGMVVSLTGAAGRFGQAANLNVIFIKWANKCAIIL